MTSYNVSDSQGVIISVQSSLQNVQAYVRSASAGEVDPRKRAFLEAVEELRKKLEAEQAQHAEEVAVMTKKLEEALQAVSAPKPSKLNLTVTKEGLLSAAAAVDAALPTVLGIVQRITAFMSGLM